MGGEGKRDAGELARGDEDTRAVGHRRRNQPDQRGDRPAHRDPVDRNAEQVGEGGAPGGDCRVKISGLRGPPPPGLDRIGHGVGHVDRWNANARGVEVAVGDVEPPAERTAHGAGR
jgi:hypothetical protein